MKINRLGNSSLNVSEVGLGCWQFGGDFGPMSEERAMTILSAAVESGITFFDTADVYGAGVSEQWIGQFTSKHDGVTVSTKFGREDCVYPDKYTKAALEASVQRASKRLQTECLDLVQLHCIPHKVLQEGDIFEWLRDLKQRGLIKEFGASVESISEGLTCLQVDGLASLQVIYNIFRQKLSDELLPQAQQAGVGIIVRLPLASGLLSGKYTQSTTFSEGDHRNYNADGQAFNVGETFAGILFADGVELANSVKALLPDDVPMATSSLRWLLDHDAVSTVIPGASSAEQVRQNAAAADLAPLGDEVHARLKSLYETRIADKIRGPY